MVFVSSSVVPGALTMALACKRLRLAGEGEATDATGLQIKINAVLKSLSLKMFFSVNILSFFLSFSHLPPADPPLFSHLS